LDLADWVFEFKGYALIRLTRVYLLAIVRFWDGRQIIEPKTQSWVAVLFHKAAAILLIYLKGKTEGCLVWSGKDFNTKQK